jgi:hypothetical protein
MFIYAIEITSLTITNYKRVKSIVISEYNTGVVTELLPRAKVLAKTKEAPSFRAE